VKRVVGAVALLSLSAAAVAAFPGTRPDPAAQAVADGCRRDQNLIVKHLAPNWAYVNDKNYPADGPPPPTQWATGTVDSQYEPWLAIHPTGVDQPASHTAYDANLNLRVDPRYDFLLGGDPDSGTGNFGERNQETGRLHTEWQEDAFPFWAWPERGDRVEMKGSWVWDCDHITHGEHTEFHPFRAIWVRRTPGGSSPRSPYGEAEGNLFISTDKTHAGVQADCAHRTKGDADAFKACVSTEPEWQDVTGIYTFTLAAPPRPSRGAKLTVRVVDRGSTRPTAFRIRRTDRGVQVLATPAAAPGRRVVVARQIFVGWSPLPARRLPVHLRVRFDSLLTRRAMDPGCPVGQPSCASPETTQRVQGTTAPGEWAMYWDVAGIWRRWPGIVPARDGRTFRGSQTVDFYVAAGRPWRLFMFGRDCDFGIFNARGPGRVAPCPRTNETSHPVGDDKPGPLEVTFRSPQASLGRHRRNSMLASSTCPAVNKRGCYHLTFSVRRIDDAARRAKAMRP
jgi:hypothetical protein